MPQNKKIRFETKQISSDRSKLNGFQIVVDYGKARAEIEVLTERPLGASKDDGPVMLQELRALAAALIELADQEASK